MSFLVRRLLVVLAIAVLLPSLRPAAAHGQAPISGVVTDGTSPIVGARVAVEGATIETQTDARGRFQLSIPSGTTPTLRVTIIGFKPLTQQVSSGQANLQLVMTAAAVNLDAIVVTGTAGGVQMRAIGNTVSKLEPTTIAAPPPNVEQLLGGRMAGVAVLPAAGQVGTGAPLRVRGTNSMSLTNEPIVFIDGIRMDSDPRQGPGQRGGSRVSRLNDLNPDDIQSIEVIKGPSAATLYGTEASNGVIQIITKRGAIGRPQFDVTVRRGTNWLENPEGRTPYRFRRTQPAPAPLVLDSVNMYNYYLQQTGTPIFHNGPMEGYSGNLSGGTEATRYFGSLSYDHDVGIVPWNWDKRLSARLNLDLTLLPNLTARLGSGYINRDTRLMQSNFDSDPFSNLVWSDPRTLTNARQGWFSAPPSEWSKFEALSHTDRVMTNVEMKYNPFKWFTHRLATGLDINNNMNSELWPRQPEGATHVWGNNALGRRDVVRSDNRLFSFDYGASAKVAPLANFVFTTSTGFQYYRRARASITADGRNFAAIPLTSVSAGATLTADESFTENSTVGLFVQQQVDWRNKMFLTGAIRGDDNSAFGAEYDAAIYPKLSGTWVMNEESFWPFAWVNQFKLRGAWGAAGQQPGTFDASRLYNSEVGYGDNPVLVPGSYGNPQLKPERSEELEFGFDASVLDGRVELNVTRYNRTIKDAIVNRPVPPSSGFTGNQIVNVARVKGWGNEVGINTQVLNGRKLGWNLGLQIATMGTRIVSLGDVGNISAGLRFEHREGYPIGGVFVKKIRNATTTATGAVISATCDGGTGPYGADQGGPDVDCSPTTGPNAPRVFIGSSTPTWQLGITNSFSVFKSLKLEARIEGSGGNYNINTEMRASHNNGDTKQVVLLDDQMVNATRQIENDEMGLYDASFLKLREVSASYTLPTRWLRAFRMSRGTFTLAARNVMMLWTGQHGWSTPRDGRVEQIDGLGDEWTWDPEIRSNSQIGGDFQTVLPPTMSVTATLRLGF